jgi:HD-GYP domain-containing protein (c-di-GMP phosphodiesterase class II)
LYNAKACIPGFFRDKLICIFFLGQKLDGKDFNRDELGFLSVLSSDAVMAIQNAWFFQDLNSQLEINKKLFLQTVMALASAIEAKDKYTIGHTERVSKYSLIVAQEIKAMKKIPPKEREDFLENLRIASLLHDIGKIGVREGVLNKKGFLDEGERREIEKHPLIGFSILKQVDEFHEPILGVKYHHERYDGKGYPEGIKGKKIPLVAQIIAVADTFDAMTSDRPYRKGLSKEEAAKVIEENKGKQFSPLIVDAFLRVYKAGKL